MSETIIISIDAMGGDAGPDMVVSGVDKALQRHSSLKVILFGDEERIAPLLDAYPNMKNRCTVEHCDVAITMDAKPSQALRAGRRVSSMWCAVDAVKKGQAQAVVSAGNTGALMAMSKVVLNTMPAISRPAIAGIWPTMRGESIVLDVGATIGADAEQLVNFAIMGEAMARTLFGIARPSIGLLNVGVEEVKGIEEVKAAGRILRNAGLQFEYCGFVEGDDIGKGTVDVVVTEGFTGNIALKTAEGTAKQITAVLREAMNSSILSRIGYVFAKGAFNTLRDRLDPRNSNGGVFLGLNGIVVKSHGGTDALGFANAVDIAIEMAQNDIVANIASDLQALGHTREEERPAATNSETTSKKAVG